MIDGIPWAIAGLFMAGILHIAAVFSVPLLAEQDAWSRLFAKMKTNTLTIADKAELALPFASPDVLHAYCLFDVASQNVLVTTPLPEAAWSVAISTRSGENFYVITGFDAKRANIRILIIPRDRLAQEASTEKSEEGDDQNIVVTPTTTGIIAIRAPLRGESFRAQATDWLKKARCTEQRALDPSVASISAPADGLKPPPKPPHGRRMPPRQRRPNL